MEGIANHVTDRPPWLVPFRNKRQGSLPLPSFSPRLLTALFNPLISFFITFWGTEPDSVILHALHWATKLLVQISRLHPAADPKTRMHGFASQAYLRAVPMVHFSCLVSMFTIVTTSNFEFFSLDAFFNLAICIDPIQNFICDLDWGGERSGEPCLFDLCVRVITCDSIT